MSVTYTARDDGLCYEHLVGERNVICFYASDVRHERTGVHARVRIGMNAATLAWTNLNVERDEDRVRLTNSAWLHVKDDLTITEAYSKEYFKHDFDAFCEGLWDAKVGNELAAPVAGSAEPKPPHRIASSFILDGGGTLYFGPPEFGKSWVLLTMAVCIDAGLSTLWPVEQRPTVFINLERSQASIENRLGAINRALGLEPTRPLVMMNRRGYSLADIYSAAERSVRQLGPDCVVFLDSITRAGAGDLTNNEAANHIMDMMNRLARTWIGIAHTPRADQTHIYGSFMFDAGADILVRAYSELRGDERGVGLITDKSNDLPKMKRPEVVAFRFGEHDEGLLGIRQAKLSEFPEMLIASAHESREDIIANYVLEVRRATATETAKATGFDRSVVSRMFSESDRFVQVDRIGREVYYGLVGSPNGTVS